MARQIQDRDLSPILAAAERWINTCLIADRSMFGEDARWTAASASEVHRRFVEHPDFGDDDFMTKLKGQMKSATPAAQQLAAEMLWALFLFPSNIRHRTKRLQVSEIWSLSGQPVAESHRNLDDGVLAGVGSGGPGFHMYRADEMTFLIALVLDLKAKDEAERRRVLTNYSAFVDWILGVPQEGSRQFRHMLRYLAFPDLVERISSNNDRHSILEAFGVASSREIMHWTDRQLDEALMTLPSSLQKIYPSQTTPKRKVVKGPDYQDGWRRNRRNRP